MHRRPSSLHAWVLSAVLLAGAVLPRPSLLAAPPGASPPSDYAVVANYLAVFCRYVVWPDTGPSTTPPPPLRIGVLGPNPFGATLDQLLAGKTLHGRRMTASHGETPDQLLGCHVVFIAIANEAERVAALAALAGKPILTAIYLGENPPAEPTGAVIELVRIGNNIRYQLNATALSAQNLQATPGLLENALRRIGDPAQ